MRSLRLTAAELMVLIGVCGTSEGAAADTETIERRDYCLIKDITVIYGKNPDKFPQALRIPCKQVNTSSDASPWKVAIALDALPSQGAPVSLVCAYLEAIINNEKKKRCDQINGDRLMGAGFLRSDLIKLCESECGLRHSYREVLLPFSLFRGLLEKYKVMRCSLTQEQKPLIEATKRTATWYKERERLGFDLYCSFRPYSRKSSKEARVIMAARAKDDPSIPGASLCRFIDQNFKIPPIATSRYEQSVQLARYQELCWLKEDISNSYLSFVVFKDLLQVVNNKKD